MVDVPSDLPSARTPLVGSDGLPTTPYYRFFASLWRRTGGRVDVVNNIESDLTEDVPTPASVGELEKRVSVLEYQLIPAPASVGELEKRIDALEYELALAASNSGLVARLESRIRELEAEITTKD